MASPQEVVELQTKSSCLSWLYLPNNINVLNDCFDHLTRDISSNAISVLPDGVFASLTNLNEL